LKSLKKRFQQRCNEYLDTGKDKTSITKISCLGQTARNFIALLGIHISGEQCTRQRGSGELLEENVWERSST